MDDALQSLGSQYQAPPTTAPTAPSAPAPVAAQNGYSPPAPVPAPAPAPVTTIQQETFNDGNTQRQVTMETSQQKFGSTTLTKVTRQEVTSSAYGAPSAPKPKTWAPVGAPGGNKPINVRAPPGVQVSQNPQDQSVTLTLGLGDNKENRGPSPKPSYVPPSKQSTQQSMFRVNKINTQAPKGIWQPSYIPDLPDRPPPEHTNLMDDMPQFHHQPEPVPEPEPEPPRMEPLPAALRPAQDNESNRRPLLDQSEDEYARMMMHMIMHGLEAPDTMYIKKSKQQHQRDCQSVCSPLVLASPL